MALSIPWVIPPGSGTLESLRWSVAGIIMDNATDDGYGCRWIAQVDGWNDSPDMRAASGPRPNRDGDWQGLDFLNGRTLTATGALFAPDRAGLRAARDRLMAAVPVRTDVRVVSNENPVRSVVGRLAGKVLWRSLNECQATFSIPIHSPSPFKQGQLSGSAPLTLQGDLNGLPFPLTFPLQLGGAAFSTVVTSGNADAFPVLIINGPMVNPVVTLVETGQRVAYTINIAARQQLVVDTDTGVALLGQQQARGAQSLDTDFFGLSPYRSNTIGLSASSGYDPSASLVLRWAPQWI